MEIAEWRDEVICRNGRWAPWSSGSLGCGEASSQHGEGDRLEQSGVCCVTEHRCYSPVGTRLWIGSACRGRIRCATQSAPSTFLINSAEPGEFVSLVEKDTRKRCDRGQSK